MVPPSMMVFSFNSRVRIDDGNLFNDDTLFDIDTPFHSNTPFNKGDPFDEGIPIQMILGIETNILLIIESIHLIHPKTTM